MTNEIKLLKFPNGLSLRRAKDKAKLMVKDGEHSKITEALDKIAIDAMELPWAKAVEQLKQSNKISIEKIMRLSDIEAIMNEFPTLTHFGNGSFRDWNKSRQEYLEQVDIDRRSLLTAIDECNKACMYLKFLNKRKYYCYDVTSYGLKHLAEYFIRAKKNIEPYYIANGAFICAAHYMGFNIKYNNDSPNVYINYSVMSPVIKWQQLRRINSIDVKDANKLYQYEKQMNLPNTEKSMMYRGN